MTTEIKIKNTNSNFIVELHKNVFCFEVAIIEYDCYDKEQLSREQALTLAEQIKEILERNIKDSHYRGGMND